MGLMSPNGSNRIKEGYIFAYINGFLQTVIYKLDDSVTSWSNGGTTGEFISLNGYDFVALKSGRYNLKNRYMSIEKYCEKGEIIGTANLNNADVWICTAL